MEILAETLSAVVEGIVDLVGERYGCLAGILIFAVLMMILVVLVALSI